MGSCVCGGYWFCWSFPSYSQGLGYGGVPFAGHAFWAEVGGDISFVTLEEFLGSLQKSAFMFHWGWRDSGKLMLYMLALVGQPSLRGRDACMVFRAKGHPGEIAGKNFVRPLSLFLLFLLSRISGFLWSGVVLWHLWIGRAGHPGPGSAPCLLRFSMLGGSLASLDWSC